MILINLLNALLGIKTHASDEFHTQDWIITLYIINEFLKVTEITLLPLDFYLRQNVNLYPATVFACSYNNIRIILFHCYTVSLLTLFSFMLLHVGTRIRSNSISEFCLKVYVLFESSFCFFRYHQSKYIVIQPCIL